MNRRIYLDHAATCFPKPSIVLDAMHSFSTSVEAAVGRGVYRSSQNSSEIVSRLRREIANWIDAKTAEEISFHAGGTEAINTALFGILRPGDHVVTTAVEHNSVLRPLHHLADTKVINWTVVPADSHGHISADAILQAIQPHTRMIALVHASNVNGAVQSIDTIGKRLVEDFGESNKPIFLCDAAQTFGHLRLSVTDSHLDVLAAPGHKGGRGPLGTGFLYVRRELHCQIRPTVFGGTGTHSESLEMPREYPVSFEAGNMNVPALAGWLAGIRSRSQKSSARAALKESSESMKTLATELYGRLREVRGVRVIGEPHELFLPVASIAIEGLPASDAAMILDTEFGIEVRSGLHCAALIHEWIGSPPDGTLRISCGESTTLQELDCLADALKEICE